jgi:hypothetical protein
LNNFLDIILDSFFDSFLHVWSNFPILFVLYLILEWYGHTKGFDFSDRLKSKKIYAPFFGAFLGLIPQCGISVVMTGIYLRGFLSTGTLIAVYIATSDEALPVILSNFQNSQYVLVIVLIKFFTATLVGIIVDLLFPNFKPRLKIKDLSEISIPVKIEPHHSAGKHDWHPAKIRRIIWHALKHATNIFLYIFVFSFVLFFLNNFYGVEGLITGIEKYEFLEITSLTLIGLIPNCIASVAIAEGFLHYGLSFGAVIAGLSSAAGVGLILLIKEAAFATYSRIILILILSALIIGFSINRIYYFRLNPSHNADSSGQYDEHGHNHIHHH